MIIDSYDITSEPIVKPENFLSPVLHETRITAGRTGKHSFVSVKP